MIVMGFVHGWAYLIWFLHHNQHLTCVFCISQYQKKREEEMHKEANIKKQPVNFYPNIPSLRYIYNARHPSTPKYYPYTGSLSPTTKFTPQMEHTTNDGDDNRWTNILALWIINEHKKNALHISPSVRSLAPDSNEQNRKVDSRIGRLTHSLQETGFY